MKPVSTAAAPAAIGPYSQAVRTGSLLFVSGQLPIDPQTGEFAASDAVGVASGLAGAADSIAVWKPLASLLLWPVAAALLARLAFARVQP